MVHSPWAFAHPGSYLSPRDLRSDAAPSRTDRDVAAGCPHTGATLIATSEELQPEEGVVMRPPFSWGNLGDLAGDKEGGALFLLVRDLLSVQSVAFCCWDGGRISLRIVCTCVALRSAMRVMTGG
jgi:hypothetical protein